MGNANLWGHVRIIKCLSWNVLRLALPCMSCLCMFPCPRCRPMKTCPLGDEVSADDPEYEPVMVTHSVWALEDLLGLLSSKHCVDSSALILTVSSLPDLTQLAVCTRMALFLMDWVVLLSGVHNIYRWSQLQEAWKQARKNRCEPDSCFVVYLIMLPCK